MALRLVVADDNFLVREGLSALLAEVEEIEVVAMATDTLSLISAVQETSPDAVLTDIRMPPSFTDEGIKAAKRIRAEHPDVGVVVLSQYVEEDYAFELLVDGVTGLGYLLKERVSDVDELVRALREVSRGGSVLDPKVVAAEDYGCKFTNQTYTADEMTAAAAAAMAMPPTTTVIAARANSGAKPCPPK